MCRLLARSHYQIHVASSISLLYQANADELQSCCNTGNLWMRAYDAGLHYDDIAALDVHRVELRALISVRIDVGGSVIDIRECTCLCMTRLVVICICRGGTF